jgi:hypothetical protein
VPPEADGRLRLPEAPVLRVKAGLRFGRNRGMEAAWDVPTKGTAHGAPLADALGRTPTLPARRVVDTSGYAHAGSLRREPNAGLRAGGSGPIGKGVPREGVIVGFAGITASAALLVGGAILYRSPSVGRGWLGLLMVLLGVLGLVASAGWLILGAYIDSHVR